MTHIRGETKVNIEVFAIAVSEKYKCIAQVTSDTAVALIVQVSRIRSMVRERSHVTFRSPIPSYH